jgi:hypothetical protein
VVLFLVSFLTIFKGKLESFLMLIPLFDAGNKLTADGNDVMSHCLISMKEENYRTFGTGF